MVEIRWTEQAADDLEAIAEFIAKDSPHYASIFCIDVLTATERLTIFPDRAGSYRNGQILPFAN